ncbi:MAG: LPS export ABC transporter periplasmic protein LptC [Alphaproteobacteria bacterium]|nr:LPS export ABC transporter periplasmic protein LptC [Alphaproteobacteria bacterium]
MTEQEEGRLNALDDRRRTVRLTSADRTYSSFIKRLRWFLPVAALAIVAALMIWPKVETELSQSRFSPQKLDKATIEKAMAENRLENAKFSSVDGKGRPFTIVSSVAVQDTKNPDIINLSAPSGTLQTNETEKMTAVSDNGVYQQKDQHLTLQNNVVLSRADGTVMKTDILYVNLATSDARTDKPVRIEGPQGTLDAQAMDMRGGGAITIFKGPAKLVLQSGNSINPKGGGK